MDVPATWVAKVKGRRRGHVEVAVAGAHVGDFGLEAVVDSEGAGCNWRNSE